MHIHNNNLSQAQTTIQQMLNSFDINTYSNQVIIPLPVLSLLIWMNLKLGTPFPHPPYP